MSEFEQIEIMRESGFIQPFCNEWGIGRLDYIRGATNKRDANILASFLPGRECSTFDLLEMEQELEQEFGSGFSVMTRCSLDYDKNEQRKQEIERSLSYILVNRQ